MRHVLSVLVAVLVGVVSGLGPQTASAEVFGGWQYKAPKGYKAAEQGDHVSFTKVTAPTFCSIALFQIRATSEALVKEQAFEWQNVVEKNFSASGIKRGASTKTKRALALQTSQAAVQDGEGNQFAATHYIVMPPGMISSVLLTSSNAAALKKCEPAAKAFVDTLAIDPATAAPVDPEARVESPVGRWANSATDENPSQPGKPSVGTVRREYTFAADGTYRFHAENGGGSLAPDQWRVVDETGTFTVTGNQLTLAPKTATSVVHKAGVAKPATKLPLEKVTYTWGKQYFDGIAEWNLVLTPPKKTARDGEFAANEKLSTSYLYSDKLQPEWYVK